MKTARLVVLGVALAAGGIAALLAGRSDSPPPPPPAPVAQIDTVEILVARNDIGMGTVVSPNDIQWQVWPTAAASPTFLRKSDRPDAIKQLVGAIARSPLVAGEPVREAKLIRADGSGFMAAILPSGMRAISTEISPETCAGGFILPKRPRRRHPQPARPRGGETGWRRRSHRRNDPDQHPRAGYRPDHRGKERTACRRRQDRDPGAQSRAGRTARRFASARHADLGLAQPHRCA